MAKCKITVIRKECYPDLMEQYLADPQSGPCTAFEVGQEFIFDRHSFHTMNDGKFCMEAWDAISRYVYAALQGSDIMRGWTKGEKMMIARCMMEQDRLFLKSSELMMQSNAISVTPFLFVWHSSVHQNRAI